MEVKAGYKKTEVGVIPEDWESRQLSEITEYTKGYPFKAKDYQSTGIRIIRVSDTMINGIKDYDGVYLDPNRAYEFRKWSLREHDLVVSTVGSKPPMYDSLVGKATIITSEYKGALLNQNAIILRSKDFKPASQFILQNNLLNERYLAHIKKIFRGNANQASITLKELFEYTVAFPVDPVEQQAIAGALNDVDALIESMEQLIAKKHLIKQGTMQELLASKKRLPGFGGDWIEHRIDEIGILMMGQSPPGNSYSQSGLGTPLLNGAMDLRENGIFVTQFTNKPTRLSKVGDLLFCIRATIGNLQFGDKEYCIGRGIASLAVFPENESKFIAYQLQDIFALMRNQSQGGVIKGLRKDELAGYKISVPKYHEQAVIAQVLSDMDAEIYKLETKLAKYRLIKQGMMQELLTGRIRLI